MSQSGLSSMRQRYTIKLEYRLTKGPRTSETSLLVVYLCRSSGCDSDSSSSSGSSSSSSSSKTSSNTTVAVGGTIAFRPRG